MTKKKAKEKPATPRQLLWTRRAIAVLTGKFISPEIAQQILTNDPEIKKELCSDGRLDTVGRDILMSAFVDVTFPPRPKEVVDSFLQYYTEDDGRWHIPCYGSDSTYVTAFTAEFTKSMRRHKIRNATKKDIQNLQMGI